MNKYKIRIVPFLSVPDKKLGGKSNVASSLWSVSVKPV